MADAERGGSSVFGDVTLGLDNDGVSVLVRGRLAGWDGYYIVDLKPPGGCNVGIQVWGTAEQLRDLAFALADASFRAEREDFDRRDVRE